MRHPEKSRPTNRAFPTDLLEMVLDEGRDLSEVLEGVSAPTAGLAGLGLEEGGEGVHEAYYHHY